MWKCESCDRHVLPVVQVCPFCTTMRVAGWSTAVVTPIVLSACYGAPPCDEDQLTDLDTDGFVVPRQGEFCDVFGPTDCDDANPAVNPDAEEICDDGIDNDCDGIEAGAGTTEWCNGLDDDCDGEIDEDGACDPPDTGAVTEVSTSALSLTLEWAGGIATCDEAGVATVTVSLRAQPDAEPAVSREAACDDGGIAMDALPAGAWVVDASAVATDGVRTWQSPARVVTLTADETLAVELGLECSAPDDPTACPPSK